MSPPPLQFSHIGIFVSDIVRMRDFYSRVLGFPVTDDGALGDRRLVFLSRDPAEHHQIVLVEGRPADLPFNVVNQISFRVADVTGLKAFHGALRRENGVSGLVAVTHGIALSLYCLDPEGNRIEIFADCPWHVAQPLREPIDLERPDEEIMADALDRIRSHPSFRMKADWSREQARKLDTAR